jgi:hypothetical protein
MLHEEDVGGEDSSNEHEDHKEYFVNEAADGDSNC